MRLIFQPERIPRTTTRAEWRRLDRSRRVLQKRLAADAERLRAIVREASEQIALYGQSSIMTYQQRDEIFMCLVNPPLVVFP